MHPVLAAALAEDRHRRRPCSAVIQQPYCACRGCRLGQRPEMRDRAAASSRRSPLNARQIPKALPFARVPSLPKNTSKGAED
jgi:hypothetical protein